MFEHFSGFHGPDTTQDPCGTAFGSSARDVEMMELRQ